MNKGRLSTTQPPLPMKKPVALLLARMNPSTEAGRQSPQSPLWTKSTKDQSPSGDPGSRTGHHLRVLLTLRHSFLHRELSPCRLTFLIPSTHLPLDGLSWYLLAALNNRRLCLAKFLSSMVFRMAGLSMILNQSKHVPKLTMLWSNSEQE